jgi:hypothetical protein
MVGRSQVAFACAVFFIVAGERSQAAIITHFSDFIADGSRSHFNGFEAIPNNGSVYTGGNGPYTEDLISVAQINGDAPNDIYVGSGFWPGSQGRIWYPNGGDQGYTTISLAGGGDFDSVGFNYGTGWNGFSVTLLFELLDNGGVVMSGSAALSTSSANYLGFSGGGFDAIRLRDSISGGGMVTDGAIQALSIDGIETLDVSAVPEPSSIVLIGIGSIVTGLGAIRRRRQAV